jgi:hypothetical protein
MCVFIDLKVIFIFSWTKNEETQLQFVFQSVNLSESFPLGVRTQYRAFSCDETYEIVLDTAPENEVGYNAVVTSVHSFPENGMYLLRSLPKGNFQPCGFIEGSRAALEQTVSKFRSEFSRRSDLIVQWDYFANSVCPQSDNVNEYLALNPLHIPLHKQLFVDNGINEIRAVQPVINASRMLGNRPLFTAHTTASVRHRGSSIITPQPRILDTANGNEGIVFSLREPDLTDPFKATSVRELQSQLSALGQNTNGNKRDLYQR